MRPVSLPYLYPISASISQGEPSGQSQSHYSAAALPKPASTSGTQRHRPIKPKAPLSSAPLWNFLKAHPSISISSSSLLSAFPDFLFVEPLPPCSVHPYNSASPCKLPSDPSPQPQSRVFRNLPTKWPAVRLLRSRGTFILSSSSKLPAALKQHTLPKHIH